MLVEDQYFEQNYSTPARLAKTKIEIQLSDSQQVGRYEKSHGTPEVAANAMISSIRFTLVILICVLLVKLGGPKGARRNSSAYKQQKGRNFQKNDDDTQYGDDLVMGSYSAGNEQQRQLFCENDNSSDRNKSQSNNNYNLGSEFHTTKTQIRRNSQPEIISSSQAQQLRERERERQRRNSEVTQLAQLKLPPGPRGLPFLGYLPFVGKEIHLTLTSLSERYGPIYQIYLGNIRVVVLNEVSLVRQAFKQPVFSGRPDTQLTRILQGYGIVNSEGALWKEQRAFLHSALRKLGAKSLMSGANGLEVKIQNQVKEFVNDLSVHADEGKPCKVRPIVARAVSSVVGSIVMNLTYRKYEEKEKFDRLIELMQEGFRLFTVAMPLDFIPIFRFLPGVSYAYKKIKENIAETSAFFQGVADEHRRYLSETFNLDSPSTASSLHPKATAGKGAAEQLAAVSVCDVANVAGGASIRFGQQQLTSNITTSPLDSASITAASAPSPAHLKSTGNGDQEKQDSGVKDSNNNIGQKQQPVELENIVVRDLVDAYIIEQKKHETDGKENYFSDQQLVQMMSDIFSAGLETVTSTIEWSVLFLILNTECQEAIQDEIDRVIGRDRLPQLEDLAHMPYTEATIYEVIRRSNVVALGNAHATLADASIGGYLIPKGTQVLTNLYGMNMNPKLWNQPDKFNPARFIVNEKARKPDFFIPFSVGRRMCLGDLLAKMEVFLFLVGLLQRYDLEVAEEDRLCPPQVKGTIGISHTPASFKVSIKSRPKKTTPNQRATTTNES